VPFNECSEDELIVLATHSLLETVPRSHTLARVGESDGWDYYLIEGTLKLVAEDGMELFVMGGSRKCPSTRGTLTTEALYLVSDDANKTVAC